MPSKGEIQDGAGITRAVQQGKGGGMSRNEGVRANAYRLQTEDESQTTRDKSAAARPNSGDIAFRK